MIVVPNTERKDRTIKVQRLEPGNWYHERYNWNVVFPTINDLEYQQYETIRDVLTGIKDKFLSHPYLMGYLINIQDLDEEETLRVNFFDDNDMVEVILRYTL